MPTQDERGARDRLWDVIVVGTGMGGSTLGWSLARDGRSVLFLERGKDWRNGERSGTRGRFVEDEEGYRGLPDAERRQRLAEGGRAAGPLRDTIRGDQFMPYVGEGVGGSSALYGMALERTFPADLSPEYGWGACYEEMVPWYERAERLYRVTGTSDPLRGETIGHLGSPPPLSAANAEIQDRLRGRGLNPYRLHLACERVAGCGLCQGYLCDKACKNDAARICLWPALSGKETALVSEAGVVAIRVGNRRVKEVVARQAGAEIRFRGRIVALAAGALGTPGILLRSSAGGVANGSGMVGRNLMRHLIDLYVLRKGPVLENAGVSKELAFNDYYFHRGERLGTVQSFGPSPPYRYLRNQPGFNIWRWTGPVGVRIHRGMAGRAVLASIQEDLPDPENRVGLVGGEIGIRYRAGKDDRKRQAVFRGLLMDALSGLGPVRAGGTDGRKALGHACGTCRAGADPATSVVDATNRSHEVDNLYIVDASYFPRSTGINPALTVAANALRVARHMSDRL